MLDAETKRKIDNCRDILVGKIPDPKSQVEQITIALIYKFMDDMDQLSIYQGGKPSFFRGEFEKYSWSSIFDRRLGGQEILNLYGEALAKMNHNPNIPQLFRDIFKNAFLPYRDPETLRLFLKEISVFTYDHSERLGDAFEYLLSVLSSQGDAGQFRTPRHIIDFIVKAVDPQLNETVLDPACGTAGFLISAYKHILKNNPKLSTAQKKRLMNNFVGYDISYDMVRLSLVNMYLHRFPEPHIHEYDTLTYEDRWQDTFDVIMANPPFMTPKGGIRPHSRFSIKANRSEVLFVDYIAEHLNPSGRAGVIVPEGIIFQSANAYKALRKMLVENYLWAVVSLPAGVFSPYSGVKTSILLLDKSLAKRIDKILFVKIKNDGFDLGAQRRPIDKNDLPLAQKCLNIYKSKVENHKLQIKEDSFSLAVLKSEIAESGDYYLSSDRYRIFEHHTSAYPIVQLGSIASINAGNSAPQGEKYFINGQYLFFRTSDVGEVHISRCLCNSRDKINQHAVDELGLTLFPKDTILFPKSGASTFLNHRVMMGVEGYVSSHLATINCDKTKLLPEFAFYLLCKIDAKSLTEDQNYPSLRLGDIEKILIPLPPLEVQEKIVAEIDGYQKIIDAARQIVENYKPTIKINPDWPMVAFKDYVFFQEGPGIRNWQFTTSGIKLLNVKNIVNGELNLDNSDKYISEKEFNDRYSHFLVEDDDIILASSGATYGKSAYFKNLGYRVIVNTSTIRLHPIDKSKILQGFIKVIVGSSIFKSQIDRLITGAAQPNFGPAHLKKVQIPLPPSPVQKQIVTEIEDEQKIVNENKKLIEIFEKKIAATISALWS
jgi:type I restriction enzyme M protein